MSKTFSTTVALKNYLESVCEKAVQTACNRLLGTLQQIIDEEYYAVYDPVWYKRTYQFWESATAEMLSKTCGQIFMNPNAMNYGFGWSGMEQIQAANLGIHGGIITDITVEHRYWDKFVEYCDKNAVRILKEELKKQGLSVK